MALGWLILTAAALAIPFLLLQRRRHRRAIRQFEAETHVDDAEFLADLGIAEGTTAATNALAVRTEFAGAVGVAPHSLSASHRFDPDIRLLPS